MDYKLPFFPVFNGQARPGWMWRLVFMLEVGVYVFFVGIPIIVFIEIPMTILFLSILLILFG